MHAPKDVAVTKLSALQKRILVHARGSMLAKEQQIAAPTEVTLCLPAPAWLDKVLCETMAGIAKARQGYVLNPGQPYATSLGALHPWLRLFAEMTTLNERIEAAAEAAGVHAEVDLTRLYELAVPAGFFPKVKLTYHPWPYLNGHGWYFQVKIEELTLVQVNDLLPHAPGAWAYDNGGCQPSSTIPELLRDLFGFPVQDGGHIDALAFCVEDIGASRYGAAQASLRRACTRLQTRGLIDIWSGQRTSASASIFRQSNYTRTRIALTAAGVAIADSLRCADNPVTAGVQWQDGVPTTVLPRILA